MAETDLGLPVLRRVEQVRYLGEPPLIVGFPPSNTVLDMGIKLEDWHKYDAARLWKELARFPNGHKANANLYINMGNQCLHVGEYQIPFHDLDAHLGGNGVNVMLTTHALSRGSNTHPPQCKFPISSEMLEVPGIKGILTQNGITPQPINTPPRLGIKLPDGRVLNTRPKYYDDIDSIQQFSPGVCYIGNMPISWYEQLVTMDSPSTDFVWSPSSSDIRAIQAGKMREFLLGPLLGKTSLVVMNGHEEEIVSRALSVPMSVYANRVVITHGPNPVIYHEKGTARTYSFEPHSKANSAYQVGAGDSFTAGMIHGLFHQGMNMPEAVALGVGVAQRVLQMPESNMGHLSTGEIAGFLGSL